MFIPISKSTITSMSVHPHRASVSRCDNCYSKIYSVNNWWVSPLHVHCPLTVTVCPCRIQALANATNISKWTHIIAIYLMSRTRSVNMQQNTSIHRIYSYYECNNYHVVCCVYSNCVRPIVCATCTVYPCLPVQSQWTVYNCTSSVNKNVSVRLSI